MGRQKESELSLPFCECGCENYVTRANNRYIKGHREALLKGKPRENYVDSFNLQNLKRR